jgi:hypothetical protein
MSTSVLLKFIVTPPHATRIERITFLFPTTVFGLGPRSFRTMNHFIAGATLTSATFLHHF